LALTCSSVNGFWAARSPHPHKNAAISHGLRMKLL
jgi:hypothetical protein